MKSIIPFILILSTSMIAHAQLYAIINDKDGFVNIHESKRANSRITGKLYIESLFSYQKDDKADWIRVLSVNSETGNFIEGYIHRNRIFPLSKFNSIKGRKIFKDSCIVSDDNLTIIIKSEKFNPKKHKLSYLKPVKGENYATKLTAIDNKKFWGTDGDLPKKSISEFKIIKNGNDIEIPPGAFKGLYEPNFKSIKVYLGEDNMIYIQMDNSDGAGGYTVIFIIKENKYLKRYIDTSEE